MGTASRLIYCIGLKSRYEAALSTGQPVVKRGGTGNGYPGGWVWQDVAGAERFLAANGLGATHAVYGVRAEWDHDTRQIAGEPYRRLVSDAQVVRIESG